jgi:hypothetical protein
LACACGGGWNTRLRLPGIARLFQIGDRGQLVGSLRRQVRHAQHHGLNARAAKIAGFDQGRRAAEALVQLLDGVVFLRSIARSQNLSDLIGGSHHAAASAASICLSAGQIDCAERQAVFVAS